MTRTRIGPLCPVAACGNRGIHARVTSSADRLRELTEHAVFYLDPHVCMRCRYRSTELLWQCPHCHDWNTFVEERIAPAQDLAHAEA